MSNDGNKKEQVAELKALRQEYRLKENQGDGSDADKFEFLGPKVPEATEENPTRMQIHISKLNDLVVTVTMPSRYPSEAPPQFKVEGCIDESVPGSVTIAYNEAIVELLDEQATYMPGLSCIAMCIMSLDDLDLSTLDLGQPGRCRSIFKVEVVNNSKQFTKSLKSAANGNPYKYYYRTIECQNNAKFSAAVDPWRACFVVCDAPTKEDAKSFMKTVRTGNDMDMNMLGKPDKIQLTVIEEFELAPKAKSICSDDENGLEGSEYRTTEGLDDMMNPFLAVVAGV
jgi:hypothetical protein